MWLQAHAKCKAPEKVVLSSPRKGEDANNENYWIVAESIEGSPLPIASLSASEATQLLMVSMSAMWHDLYEANIVRRGQDLYLINTEPSVMTVDAVAQALSQHFFAKLSPAVQAQVKLSLKDNPFPIYCNFLN